MAPLIKNQPTSRNYDNKAHNFHFSSNIYMQDGNARKINVLLTFSQITHIKVKLEYSLLIQWHKQGQV